MGKKRNSNTPALTDAEKKQVKVDNFARVCPPRVDKALKAIRVVGDCTLPTYSYTPKQAEAVVGRLQMEVDTVKERFAGVQGKTGGFTLPS